MPEATGEWGRGDLLVALWLLVPVVGLVLWSLRSRARALVKLALAGIEVARPSRRVHRTRLLLTVVGLAFALVSLAQPRWGYRWQDLPQEGRAIAVLLDVSLSMDAQDVSPSRMERARRELLDLADELRGDKVGLVQFAGGAYPRMPLTLDIDAFRRIVRDSSTSTLRAQGSDLGRGIDVAVELLAGVPAGDRAIIILSDGEDQVGQARASAEAAAEKGIHIYTLGIGTEEGAPIPMADGGFKKDKSGAVVLTRLDRTLLQQVAAVGAGAYADSVAGTQDIRAIYRDEILGGLEAAELGVRREKVWTERYQWPLGLGFALLLLASTLRPPRARRVAADDDAASTGRAAALLPLLLLPALLASLPATAANGAADGTAAADPELQRLLDEQTQRPGDLAVAERVGRALFEAGRYDQAHEVLTGVAQRSLDPDQRQRARTNAGLAAYRAGRLVDAVQEWQEVLGENAEHEAAGRNAQAVQEEIQRRLQQQPPEQQPQQGENGEEGEPQDGEQEPQQGDTGAQPPPQEGEQGEPQEGEQGEQSEPQDGEPQDGEQQSPPEDDGTREPTEAPAQPADGEPQEGEPDESGETFQAEGADSGEPGEEADGAVHRPGTMSEQEADRLLEGVEEGSPRVVIDPDSRGGEDW